MNAIDVALLQAEWNGMHFEGPVCPCCGAYPEQGRVHRPECAMDLALGQRGWSTQEDRDRARARIGLASASTLPPEDE